MDPPPQPIVAISRREQAALENKQNNPGGVAKQPR